MKKEEEMKKEEIENMLLKDPRYRRELEERRRNRLWQRSIICLNIIIIVFSILRILKH